MAVFPLQDNFGRKRGRVNVRATCASVAVFILTGVIFMMSMSSCGRKGCYDEAKGRQRALRVQRLRNLSPGADVLPVMRLTVDSMRRDRRDVFYFAAMNVLIDQLFSLDRIAEADSMASLMVNEAQQEGNVVALASAHRVKGQILYKLGQPVRALAEYENGRAMLPPAPGSLDEFSTAATLDEWIWIASRKVGDTERMDHAALRYADEVRRQKLTGWNDSTRHFDVTALAFLASEQLGGSHLSQARALLDSASLMRLPSMPVRAYEHFYSVRSELKAAEGDYSGAVADIDTLIRAHDCFPWFKAEDLLRKAHLLALFSSPQVVADAYSDYISFTESLLLPRNDARISELTVLYRQELERGHRLHTLIIVTALCIVLLFLGVVLLLSIRNGRRERKKNLLLIERLHEIDRQNAVEDSRHANAAHLSDIERLDQYMLSDKPFRDPAFGRRELAAAIGVSQTEVARIIREQRAMSIVGYINFHRLEEARRQLEENTSASIAEIAQTLGFGTARTLQRAFKSRFEMTPSQYRELSTS